MKNSTILSICMIALTSIMGLSCEKNSEEVSFTEVEYGILGIDEHIYSITYTDASGNPIVVDDPSTFVNGSKKLSVSTKPFTARMQLTINNNTSDTKSYTIGILINGEPKAITTVYCAPFDFAIGEVEFIVQ